MNEIKCITFKTQQTIIGEVIDSGDVGIIVKNPVQVIPVPARSANDPGGIGFAPYLAFVDEFEKGITLQMSDILTINTPVADLSEQYRRMFSRIELAPAGLKI